MNIKTVNNFISKENCQYIMNAVKNIETWDPGGSEFWDNRCLNIFTIESLVGPECSFLIIDSIKNVQKVIKDHYHIDEIYPDLIQVIRWFPGLEQPPHADDMTDTTIEGFEHRLFGSLIYLNDDYKGGRTFYPKHNHEIIPKTGMLAIHPGDPEHLHGVTKVEDNIRYTIAAFWTSGKNKMNGW